MSDASFAAVPLAGQAEVLATLVSAFSNDPVERWMYPDDEQYRTHFPEFLKAFGGKAFDEHTVWGIDECSAVALWLPPGTAADGDAIAAVLTATVAPEQHNDLFAVVEDMDAAHPTYPHWYLPWLGVRAALAGTGLGSRLLGLCLRVVDDSHLPAYLETPNPRTIPFYQRHGFELVGEASAGACPPIAFMLRAAH